jgi:segregation and condensation protein A
VDYQVAIDVFHGPMDLLLHLVKRQEVDILDIPVAKIADQFKEYLDALKIIDLETAGDFLVMAATLTEIKSRMLLPHNTEETEEEQVDPRRELVRQLVEYRRAKDRAAQLEQLASERHFHNARQPSEEEGEGGSSPRFRKVEMWDLLSAFARLVRETQTNEPTHIIADDTPQQVYEEKIKQHLTVSGRSSFRDIFQPPYTRARLIGYFLALLELIRHGFVVLDQDEPFSEIFLSLAA